MPNLKEENETVPCYPGAGIKKDIAKIIKIPPLENIFKKLHPLKYQGKCIVPKRYNCLIKFSLKLM